MKVATRTLVIIALCGWACGAACAQENEPASAEIGVERGEGEASPDADEVSPVPDNEEAPEGLPEETPGTVESTEGELAPVPTPEPESPAEQEGLDAVNTLYRNRVADGGAVPEPTPSTEGSGLEPERAQGFSGLVQAFAALCILCGIIVLLGYLLRMIGRRTPLLSGQRYGTVLGRIALTPRASLHFVRMADRILVVGVTQQSVSLISEFPQDAFGVEAEAAETEAALAPDFMSHLRSAAEGQARREPDEELASLRGDLQRLQRYLKQHTGSPDV